VHVTVPAAAQLITSASQSVALGGAVHDTATLSGGSTPRGTITFRLYGQRDTSCSGSPVFTSIAHVNGNGDYTSGSFSPTAPGAYRWVARYSGDAANHPAGPTACGDSAELAVVRPADITPVVPAFSTTASPSTGVGAPIHDVAHVSGGIDPGGTVTFELFGPTDTACSGQPLVTTTAPVSGNGNYTSATFVVQQAGTYRWVATYSGDALNTGVGPTTCGAGGETVDVSSPLFPNGSPGGGSRPPTPPNPKPKQEAKPKPKPKPPSFTG
jgi:hypothetical protein